MTRRNLLFAALTLTLLSLPTRTVSAQGDGDPYVDTVAQGKGRINYATGVVKATGYGAPPTGSQNPAQARLMALGAAKTDALRNLAMAVSSIQVTATTKVKNYVTESDTIETKITALLQNAQIVSETLGKDGIASVTVEIPLYGKRSVATAVLAEVLLGLPIPVPVPAAVPVPAVSGGFKEPKPIPKNIALQVTPPTKEGPFTSVIVDCRGLEIQAVMSPKLYDVSGREIYGTLHVDIDYAIEVGIVGYPRTVEEALVGKRTGEKPLIVRAIRAKDPYKIDIMLSNEDGRRILEANKRDGFLEKCRVILLCDPVR
ncbi:LPP20 family lipoprotein [Armatimonas sp.]|uniref:LPP20 family lipoprotein n=1 Tax=Armatimonas sp. TaxID=1872638 RepID=UPI0037535783